MLSPSTARFAIGISVVFLILVLPAGAREEKEKAREPVYKTPEEVFDAFIAAGNNKKFRTWIQCCTHELQMDQAAILAADALNQQHAAQGDGKLSKQIRKDYQDVLEALDKYGLKYEVTKNIKTEQTLEGQKKTQVELAKLIKDPTGLWVALTLGYQKANGDRGEPGKAKLTELKIDGDKAKAVAVFVVGEREMKLSIEFAKKGEGWKVSKNFYLPG